MKLSLIIPCYNEAENLPLLFDRCAILLKQSDVEVIFVDNGSTDKTQAIFSQLLPQYPGFRGVHVKVNQGYGYGILSGLKEAQGDILGWTHADLQTDPADALKVLSLFDQYGPDIFIKGRRYGRPLADVVFTIGMSFFETLLLTIPLWDINAQPTFFSKKFFESWNNPPHDFSLDLYAYYKAKREGLAIHRFPVLFGQRAHGVSHWNISWAAKGKFIARTLKFSLSLRRSLREYP